MSLQVEKLEKNMAKLTIEVSAEDLDKAMEKAYQKQKSRISLPGFRKGKAPRKMIETRKADDVYSRRGTLYHRSIQKLLASAILRSFPSRRSMLHRWSLVKLLSSQLM